MKACLISFLFISFVYAQSFEERVLNRQSKSISGDELIEFMIDQSPIRLGECEFGEIKRSQTGVSFVFKRGWKKKRYNVELDRTADLKIHHNSDGSASIYHYAGFDHLYLQISCQKELVELYHYYQNTLFERLFLSQDKRYHECRRDDTSVVINQEVRGSTKKEETPLIPSDSTTSRSN